MEECQICEKLVPPYEGKGEEVYDVGFVCNECLERAENVTGYCPMSCQLTGRCDGSC